MKKINNNPKEKRSGSFSQEKHLGIGIAPACDNSVLGHGEKDFEQLLNNL